MAYVWNESSFVLMRAKTNTKLPYKAPRYVMKLKQVCEIEPKVFPLNVKGGGIYSCKTNLNRIVVKDTCCQTHK